VQNDAVGFATKTMFDIIQSGAKGEVSQQAIGDAKLSRAREYVLYQQSSGQMLNRLMGTGLANFEFFTTYAEDLAGVSTDDFNKLLGRCEGKEVVTIVGPKENIEPQLKEESIEYQVIDWEADRRALLTEKERKKEDKKKNKKKK